MKKGIVGIILVLALTLVLSLVLLSGCGGAPSTPSTPTPTPSPELLTDGSFESGALSLPWEALGNSVVINTDAHTGTHCVKTTPTANWQGVQQEITQVLNDNGPGTYHVVYYAKLASGSASNSFMIIWAHDNGGGMSYDAFPESHPTVTDQWSKVEATINMTWTGTLTKSYIATKQDMIMDPETENEISNYPDLFIDDFSMRKVN